MCWRGLLMLIFVATALASQPVTAQGPFRESVAVDVDSQIVRSIETAREHLTQQQWGEAIPILQQIIESRKASLIAIEPGRYVSSANYCHLLISLLPADGLMAYRQQIDPRFAERFELARETFDEAELSVIVRNAFNCSFADEAILLLADLKIERGGYAAAREYLELLVPAVGRSPSEQPDPAIMEQPATPERSFLTYRNSSVPREQVFARLVLCSILERDLRRAETELNTFAVWYPEANEGFAGRKGLLSETLRAELRQADRWPVLEGSTETTFAGQSSRCPHPVSTVRPVRVLWRRSVSPPSFHGPEVRPLLKNEPPLALHPIVADGVVFVANSSAVFAFDLETGQPAWGGDESDTGSIFPGHVEDRPYLHLPETGVPFYTLSAADGRLFARLGAPFLRKSPRETNTVSEIVGLDVGEREGQLDLRIMSNQIEPISPPTEAAGNQFEKSPQATTWSFEGAPVISAGRLFVSLRQGAPEDRTVVACFDALTGKLVWRSGIVASLTSLPDHLNLLGTNLLTLDNGRLFLATGTGAIAALEAETGRILWIVTYESLEPGSLEELSDPRRFGLAPCLSAQGIVIAAPQDSDLLFALEATSGRLVWSQRLSRQARHLVGVNDGRLFVAGDSLQAFSLLTGRPEWNQPVSLLEHTGQTFGRPVMTRDEILWPQHGELLYVAQTDGSLRDRINLREAFGISAGNLLLHGNRLIIAQPDGVVVLTAD